MNLREFCQKYRNGDYLKKDTQTQIKAGWYDFVCRNEELAGRLEKIWDILGGITNPYVLDNYRVWFKNGFPYAPYHDVIRFDPLDEKHWMAFNVETNDLAGYKYKIFTARNDYKMEAGYDDIREVIAFINRWGTLEELEFPKSNNKRKIYLSGKITGTDDYLERFAEAEKKMEAEGFIVINHAKICESLPDDTTWEQYMDVCMVLLKMADVIFMMKGYRESRGAQEEIRAALKWNLDILYE